MTYNIILVFVYHIVIWCFYILQNDNHDRCNHRLSPYKLITKLLTIFPVLYLTLIQEIKLSYLSVYIMCQKLHGTIIKNVFNHLLNDSSFGSSFHFDQSKEMETALLILEPFTFSIQVLIFLLFPLFELG